MSLEFGVFDHLDRNDLPLSEYYEQRLQVIEAFDRLGFYAYHVAEHHFTPLGMAPSPSVFLSAIAQRSRRLTWKGRYDQFADVPMELAPLQKPHPPLWYGAHSPESAERAARAGLHIVTNDMPGKTRAITDRYREIWSATRRTAPLPKMGMVRFIMVADTDQHAMTIARRAYLRWRSSFSYLFEMHGTLPESPLRAESFDALIAQGQAIAGSPDTVRAFLAAQIRECGCNYVVGQFCFGDLQLEEMLRSVELFAGKVMRMLRGELSL